MKKYKKTLKSFTKEGFIDIINKSNTKVECLMLLREYTERNNHTIRTWIKRYDLLDLYNSLYHPITNLTPGCTDKKLTQKEINYWKSLVSNSNSYKEVLDKHSNNNNGYPVRSYSTLFKYTKPKFTKLLSDKEPKLRIRNNIMKMISKQLRNMGTERIKSLDDILGIEFEDFIKYIESNFTDEMDLTTYGSKWSIQHIIPRSLCENPNDVYLLNRYTNLIPLTISQNSIIGNTIIPSQLNEWHFENKRIQQLLNIHDLRYATSSKRTRGIPNSK
jgi:hypothetical protein